MCGVAGIFAYGTNTPPVDREELLRIRDAMKSRGPDGSGVWISADGKVGFAHRRLSIIDVSEAGRQPMATENGRVHIVFNGAIYNYQSIRDGLLKKGHRFVSHSDTEVLLNLYLEKGTEMVEELRGMYAFAVYDEANQSLFLARDPFGIKPVYYSDDGQTLRFASQVKALLKSGRIAPEPDPAGHVGFFLWGNLPDPHTCYKAIHALPAGSTLWMNTSGRRLYRTFCDLTDELTQAELAPSQVSAEECAARLREALSDSVRQHLVADVPVGVFLSSGIDSPTITSLAVGVGAHPPKTITLGFDEFRGTNHDETRLSRRVSEQFGTNHSERWISKRDFFAEMDRMFDFMDQPSVDGINSYFVSKVAAESGMKVALSGLGGDEIFQGYPSFGQIPSMVRAFSGVSQFRKLGRAFRRLSAPVLKLFTSPKYAGLFEYAGSYGGAYLVRRALFMPWELPQVLDPEIVREGWKELQPLARLEETVGRLRSPHLRVTALELTWYMRHQLLRDTDWASMAHSLEVRVPYVDLPFLRSVASLIAGGRQVTKRDLARTPPGGLPDEVLRRGKTGFAIPFREWLMPRGLARNLGAGLREWAMRVWKVHTGST
jgi:asparagine synthase (glutamine-hydrolysing)